MHNDRIGPSKIIDAGVDYLTVSIPNKHPRLNDFRIVACEEIARLRSEGGHKWTDKLMQYEGEGCKEFFWGEMATHHILQSKGHNAQNITRKLQEWELRAHITRIDTQITTETGAESEDFAEELRSKLGRRKVRNSKGIRCAINSFEGANCDSGFAWGNRDGEASGRCYDAHQKHPIQFAFGARRIECQWTDHKADSVYKMLIDGQDQSHLAWQLAATQWSNFKLHEPWMDGWEPVKPKGQTVRSSDEKTIYWLINMVAPVLSRIVKSDKSGLVYRTFWEALHPPCEVQYGETRQEVAQLKRRKKEQ